jgi:nucleotide-binding universal stress UspA family protein
MYKKILIPLDNSKTDEAILRHIRPLAKLTGASLVFIHVADGYGARFQEQLNLQDSEEIKKDRSYLESREKEFRAEGFKTQAILDSGDPAKRILAIAEKENCDLIAMSTHGHRFLNDLVLGSVADNLRHRTNIPILMIRATENPN